MNARLLFLCGALVGVTASPAFADPSGRQWGFAACGAGCPMGQACVGSRCAPQFRIASTVDNTGGGSVNGGLAYSTVVNRTIAAFAAWNTGRVACSTSYRTVHVGSFATPSGTQAVNGNDRLSNVIWLSGQNWRHMGNVLALTTTTFLTSNNEIIDADMEINNNLLWSDNLAANTYDAESVILHEAGHFGGLDHIGGAANAVMYPIVNLATSKRVLTSLDEADICTVYPGVAGSQGTSCTADGECNSGLVCRGRTGSTTKICTTTCTTNSTCGVGSTCQAANTGMACLPQVGSPDLCKFCQTGGECNSGLCLRFIDGASIGQTFCSLSCTESAQCGPGYTCDQADRVCVPNAATCTNQCTSATQCATGYTCTGGTCVPRGDPGDPCGVSLVCKSCGVCTRESENSPNAFCRTCCAGMNAGGFCNGCADTACMTNYACTPLVGNSSSVCLPGSALPTTCQACNNGMCAQGLQCVGGRCRTACNPAAPGACVSCFNTGSSNVCACSDELSSEGEPCGQLGQNTFAACAAGLACVGSTNTACRARCDINQPNSCRTGQTCQLMNGLAVCVPGTEGSTCANCTNTGQCNAGLTCFLGRCYQPCNVNVGGACATCVQSDATGAGICGCADQISPENEACGTSPSVKACQTGTRCLAGVCRARCDPQVAGTCPVFTECQSVNGDYYCADQVSSGGGGGTGGTGGGRAGGGGGSRPTGGGTGGGNTDLGCGCGPGGSPIGALLFGVVALLRRRRAS